MLQRALASAVRRLCPGEAAGLGAGSCGRVALLHSAAAFNAGAGAAAAKKPAVPVTTSAGTGSSASAAPAVTDKVYDFKPVGLPHQAIYEHPKGAFPGNTATWTPSSRRTGMLLLKCGMTADFDMWGARRALTALKVESAVVVGQVTEAERGYTALQIGAGRAKHVNKPQRGYLAKQGIAAPPAKLAEFRVTPDALLPVGTALHVRHFVPGQYINVTGTSQGKGFQGGMKRWGFAGQAATHGNSVSHRVLGSTGCRHDPGRVFKGKKMPGRMGGDTVTTECLRVYKVDLSRGLVYVQGAVPGKAGSYLRVVDAPKKPWKEDFQPPFPTYKPTAADVEVEAKWEAARAAGAIWQTPIGTPLSLPPFELVVAPPAVDPFGIPENEENEEV